MHEYVGTRHLCDSGAVPRGGRQERLRKVVKLLNIHLDGIHKAMNTVKNITLRQAINSVINKREFRLQLPKLHSLPQVVDIVLTKSCNLKCVFCKDYETTGAKQVSIENFEKVARQLFPTARMLNICSGGEPYMHKQLKDLLRIAHRYKVKTWVLSNGMLLNENLIRTIVREELISRHGFSVDGIKASTVEAIRVKAKLDVIIDNIQMLIRIRGEEGKQKPGIVIRYVLMHSNIEELPDAVRYWGEIGIDIIDCSYLSLCNDIDHQESLYFHQDLMVKVFNEARIVAAHYPHLSLHLPSTSCQEQPLQHDPMRCTSPWNFVMIGTDGQVLPCYKSWGIINMGNVYNEDGESFKEIWNNSQYQALRRTTNNDILRKHYSYCSACECRFGMGNLAAHLGDDTWLEHLDLDAQEKSRVIAHRAR